MPKTADTAIRQFKRSAWQNRTAVRNYQKAVANEALGSELEKRIIASCATGKILDAGAGNGRITTFLSEMGHDIVAMDISMHMLCVQPNHVSRVCGDIERMPFKPNSFNTIVATWVLLHFPNWELLLRELVRLLRPGGLLLFEMSSLENIIWSRLFEPNIDRTYQDPGRYESFVDLLTLQEALERNGLFLEKAIPYDHLNNNILFNHAAENCAIGANGFLKLLKSTDVRNFWLWLESNLLSEFPPGLSHKTFFIAKKTNSITIHETVFRSWTDSTKVIDRIVGVLLMRIEEFTCHFNNTKGSEFVFEFFMFLEELLRPIIDINFVMLYSYMHEGGIPLNTMSHLKALAQKEISFWHKRLAADWYGDVDDDRSPRFKRIPIGPLLENDLLTLFNQTMEVEALRS